MASAPPDAPGLPPTLDPRAVVDGYVLRRALDTPPRPRSEVPLAWPPGWFSSGPMVGAFTVFIDERGVVQRIVADGPTLPPRLQQAAEEAFKATAFEPGRVGAQAVKSLIRVEVAFTQDTPVQGAPTVVRQRPL
ncbi:hypothetical protein ABXN37_06565 [Piscinibacter sakaiensis]|uniref:TonB domain protein n=1 Tax=Piscinibacter sakaiensis TaxID=1547922 RepID=A0A0K8NY05_PISS1|nr:hypothetical protein [Piscinibacter sakaiensis]GAP34815.1 TonB domain protein [Piscinibacter sakaiensis]